MNSHRTADRARALAQVSKRFRDPCSARFAHANFAEYPGIRDELSPLRLTLGFLIFSNDRHAGAQREIRRGQPRRLIASNGEVRSRVGALAR